MDDSRLENREPLRLVVMGAIGLGLFAMGVWVGASFFGEGEQVDEPTSAVERR